MLENNLFDDEEKKFFDEEAKKEEEFLANELKKKNEKKDKGKGGKKGEIILSEEEEDSFKKEDDDENQENGIIQKKLKILVINGKLPGTCGKNWVEARALVQNGTNNNVIWGKEGCRFVEKDEMKNLYKSDDKEDLWNDKASLCCGESGSAVMQLPPDKIENLPEYAASADVVVLVDTDEFLLDDKLNKDFQDMFGFRKVILYGDNNGNLNFQYPKDTLKCKHLGYEEGCENLLRFIQQKVYEGKPDSNFIGSEIELEAKKEKLNIKEFKEIEVLSDFGGKNKQKRLFDKVKQYAKKYAKKYPKSTVAGGVAGAGVLEELFGKLLFGKSILGGIFGYNSNPKEKDAKNVKDNKKDEKKSDKKVNNSGNQVK